jgi:endoglucanase
MMTMISVRTIGACLCLSLAACADNPLPQDDERTQERDDAQDDEQDDSEQDSEQDDEQDDEQDEQDDEQADERDAGARGATKPDAGGSKLDGGAQAPRSDAGRSSDAGPAAEPDAGPAAAIDAASGAPEQRDAGRTAEPEQRDGGGTSGQPSGLIAQLEGKTMHSSKPTGAATWLVNADPGASRSLIDADMNAAGDARFPVFTLYRYYPNSGTNAAAHKSWVTSIAELIGKHQNLCVVVLEPDAFALKERADVDAVLDVAIGILKEKAPNAALFLDVGHSDWLAASAVVSRAKAYANFSKIEGFALNTSNFQATDKEVAYARQLHAMTDKPSIIDTSRNGLGRVPSTIFNPPESEWDPGPKFAFHPDDPAVLFNYYNKPSNERD